MGQPYIFAVPLKAHNCMDCIPKQPLCTVAVAAVQVNCSLEHKETRGPKHQTCNLWGPSDCYIVQCTHVRSKLTINDAIIGWGAAACRAANSLIRVSTSCDSHTADGSNMKGSEAYYLTSHSLTNLSKIVAVSS
jgi:hypothetical protein